MARFPVIPPVVHGEQRPVEGDGQQRREQAPEELHRMRGV